MEQVMDENWGRTGQRIFAWKMTIKTDMMVAW